MSASGTATLRVVPSELFAEDPNVRSGRDCLRWLPDLATAHVGATLAGLPVVLPLPCRQQAEELYLLVSEARSLRDALDGAVVAICATGTEPGTGLDWTILAIGPAAPAGSGVAVATMFGGGTDDEVFRVVPGVVTARPIW